MVNLTKKIERAGDAARDYMKRGLGRQALGVSLRVVRNVNSASLTVAHKEALCNVIVPAMHMASAYAWTPQYDCGDFEALFLHLQPFRGQAFRGADMAGSNETYNDVMV